jgi:hypothetical protein
MSIVSVILKLFIWFFSLIGIVGVVGLIPFGVTGIVFLIIQANEKDIIKKKSYKKKGIVFLVLPWALIAGSLFLIVIFSVIKVLLS